MNHAKTVISLVGRTKSGKSTLGRKLARYLRTGHVEVSDIVGSIPKDQIDSLPQEVENAIERKLQAKERSIIIVSGIRELSVAQYLRGKYNYYGFEVTAEVPVRYQRGFDDNKYKDADEFIRSEIRELDLGIEEVEDDAPFAIPTSPLTNPDRIIKAVVKKLRSQGVGLR